MGSEQRSAAHRPDFPLGRPGTPFDHAGPRIEPRIVAHPVTVTSADATISAGADLVEALTSLTEADAGSASVELVSGDFAALVYVHPDFGRDATHPMSFTEDLEAAVPARLRRGSATVGQRHGRPFAHLHASFVDAEDRLRAGHLLPGTRVGASGMRVRLHRLHGAIWVSDDDPETGFPVFTPMAVTPRAEPSNTTDSSAGVVARIRPGEPVDSAVADITASAGFARTRVLVGLGSTVGALLDPFDSRRQTGPASGPESASDAPIAAPWPAVEFTHLEGDVAADHAPSTGRANARAGRRPSTRLSAEVVDVNGNVVAGVVRPGENPVAVTFEVLLTAT